jgi:CO/xanthine dehydrogenase FAD-binding subunit
MEFVRPGSWAEALQIKAERPEAVPIAGGTDLMVELNFDRRRPELLLDIGGVAELGEWRREGDAIRIGAGLPYTRLIAELADELPGLAMAARTVASPQIRNRGTLGGNLATASPAGDGHPALLAANAAVELTSVRGTRTVPVDEFFTGVKRTVLAADELISAVLVERADGPQQFAKVGTRNAMVIAVCAFGLALHPKTRTVGTGLGSVAPTPRRARRAEEFAAELLGWESGAPLSEEQLGQFGELVAKESTPIDDVRGTARYRRHAIAVLAKRTLRWAWSTYQEDLRCA